MVHPIVTTRAVTEEDAPLLFDLFVNGEAGAWMRATPVDSGPVLRRMFDTQQADYARRFPQARHEIILVDGEAAGQVHWVEIDEEVHLIDIGVLPRYRRHGAAAAALTRLFEHARGAGKPVRSMVAKTNAPSLALHARFGFGIESQDEMYYFLIAR